MNSVPSLKTMSMFRVAVTLCNEPDFKNELLNGPGLEYENEKKYKNEEDCYEYWIDIIRFKTDNMKTIWMLPTSLHKGIKRILIPLAKEMLGWCRYHSAKFDLPHTFSVKFLNDSLFTCEGKLNKQKAVEEMVKNEALSVTQRFKLACGYMMVDDIYDLWNQMPVDERHVFIFNATFRYHESKLASVWTDHLDKILESKGADCHTDDLTFWKESFEQCAYDLNAIAVRRCWDKLPLHIRNRLLIDVAHRQYDLMVKNQKSGMCVILLSEKCYIDMICVLLSIMSEEVKQQFLRELFEMTKLSRLLKYLM